jgi:hypothetical protein
MIGSLVPACNCLRGVLKHSLFGSPMSGNRRAACKKAGEPGSTEMVDSCVCGHATCMQAALMQGHIFQKCLLVCFLLYFLIKKFNYRTDFIFIFISFL